MCGYISHYDQDILPFSALLTAFSLFLFIPSYIYIFTCSSTVQNLLSSILLSKNIKIKVYRTVIFPVVCRYETLLLTLREEHRLRVFENTVLRGIFGPKRSNITGEWRKLHNREPKDLYYSPNVILLIKSARMRWVGCIASMGGGRGAYRVLVG